MNLNFREGTIQDIDFLVALEKAVFPDFQQSKKKNLIRALNSSFQKVIIVEDAQSAKPIGAAVLFKYKHVLRIYSIGVLSNHQNSGIGKELLEHIKAYAQSAHYRMITLEAREKNARLVDWYLSKGFASLGRIEDYYMPNEHAVKLGLNIATKNASNDGKNIIVIDLPYSWPDIELRAKVISVKDYINNPEYQNESSYRVFNLCSSYKYQSYGYYVSLLASARGQRAIPSSSTIKDIQITNVMKALSFDLNDIVNKSLDAETETSLSFTVFFGQTQMAKYKKLATKLFQIYEIPLFSVHFIKAENWMIKNIKVLTYKGLSPDMSAFFFSAAQHHFNRKRYHLPKLSNYKYDIAVLVNPSEENPPSNEGALEKFRVAAHKKGVYVEFITKKDINRINEFDALFIRETTNVNHPTYELSRLAFAEGLVVMDDPWSILRCSNKIYQHELFRKHKIRTPLTLALAKNMSIDKVLDELSYPMVLKQPDSAFSLGVIKVNDKAEAKEKLASLFKKTDMVICQEFLYSELDWRIGILDNKPLFACKYYMTKGHWQIYNWNSEEEDKSGNHETVPIEEVPPVVLSTALKAAALIGDGLYGVDLKYVDNKVYVIEVNDNPNVDAGVEDEILGDDLYKMIVDAFVERIELLKNTKHINLVNNS